MGIIIVVDKVLISPLFYWVLFPLNIRRFGFVNGAIWMFVLQVAISMIWWIHYDFLHEDLIGIIPLKENCAKMGNWIRSKLGIGKGDDKAWVKTKFAIEYLICSWQLIPPFMILCMRRNGEKRPVGVEIMMIVGSSAFATLWWSLYAVGILKLPSLWRLVF